MKKIIASIVFCCMVFLGYSQTTLSFCTGIENDKCTFNNTKFITTPDSTSARIFMMVSGADGNTLGTTKLVYKSFQVNEKGEELFLNTLNLDVQKDWVYAWQPATFNTDHRYIIKIYNDADLLINSKGFELIKGAW